MIRVAAVALILTTCEAVAQVQPQAMNPNACSYCALMSPPQEPTYLNRIRLLAGIGPDGMTLDDKNPGAIRVEPFYGPIFGIGYERLIGKRMSLSVEAMTGGSTGSKTYIAVGGIGLDF